MAPLPESNTARAFLTYRTAGEEHTLMARFDGAFATAEVAGQQIDLFLGAMNALVYNSLFVRYEVSQLGSNVRVPQPWPGRTEWGGSAGGTNTAPYFWSFTGKDTSGRRFRVELFGRAPVSNEDWRLFAIDDTSVQAAIEVLQTEEAVFLTIAGNQPLFNQYANRSVSQHWVGELR